MVASKKRFVQLRSHKKGAPVCIAKIALDGSNRKTLQSEAMRWRYIVRQRSRWSLEEDSRRNIEKSAIATLKSLGVSLQEIEALAVDSSRTVQSLEDGIDATRMVEVAIPHDRPSPIQNGTSSVDDVEDGDWAARIMPWEHLITAATKRYRRGNRMVVVRRLIVEGNRIQKSSPKSYSIFVAAPGPFAGSFDFENEIQQVHDSLSFELPVETKNSGKAIAANKPLAFLDLHKDCGRDPDLKFLQKWLEQNRPDILHVTGVDLQLGSQLLKLQNVPRRDGIFLATKSHDVQAIDGDSFAKAVASESHTPELVTFNLWHSGARIAPATIASGARAAIGFEHTFDDGIAELFFAHFYEHYLNTGWSLREAFMHALHSISPYQEQMRGSSIILWTRDSLLKSQAELKRSRDARPRSTIVVRSAHPLQDDISELLEIEAVPKDRLNYASLHNKASLLQNLVFKFKRGAPGRMAESSTGELHRIDSVRDLNVTVTLFAGSEAFPYRTRLSMTESERVVDLAQVGLQATKNHAAGGIFVPLTSQLLRTVDESMLTNIHVLVEWHEKVLYNQTFSVKLAPVDEWRFEDDEIIWMSSFVQPRDPAIPKIIDSAQRYLACLRDDYTAGFDGYQSYDPDADDPWKGIDDQVRAVWTAISMDFELKYINPPPSYSENAQRLRTPSRVLLERRGTCVDLALLFAACLEWIEIYPVIFNLNDHAFPGYWRDLTGYESFRNEPRLNAELLAGQLGRESRIIPRMMKSWYSERDVYGELRNYISPPRRSNERDEIYERERPLVPLETVYLTNGYGFNAAKDAARGYFAKTHSGSFHSLIDIVNSRSWVTPIPLSSLQDRA